MKALVIPVSSDEKMYLIDIGKDALRTYYKTIGCRVIDIVTLGYANKGIAIDAVIDDEGIAIDAVIDDEGLLNHSPVNERFLLAYFAQLISCPLFGIVIVVMTDENTGETTELNMARVKDTLINNFGFVESDFPCEE